MADATRRGLVGSRRRQASSQGESESVVAVAEAEGGRRGVAAGFVVEVGDGESGVGGARFGGAAGEGAVGEGAPFSQSARVMLRAPPSPGDELVVVVKV